MKALPNLGIAFSGFAAFCPPRLDSLYYEQDRLYTGTLDIATTEDECIDEIQYKQLSTSKMSMSFKKHGVQLRQAL
jgi:hypothetical protein